jgi:molecular chaperone DnaK
MSEHSSGWATMPLQRGRTVLSLGIETKGGFFTPLIQRDTVVPCRRVETFTTADDNQSQISVTVYQGQSDWVADNELVGRYEVALANLGPRGTPVVEIAFDVDLHGMFRLTARDGASGDDLDVRTG